MTANSATNPTRFLYSDDLRSHVNNKRYEGRGRLSTPRFCNSICKLSFRADRRAGLIYSPVNLEFDDGEFVLVDHVTASLFTRCCPYCGTATDKTGVR